MGFPTVPTRQTYVQNTKDTCPYITLTFCSDACVFQRSENNAFFLRVEGRTAEASLRFEACLADLYL